MVETIPKLAGLHKVKRCMQEFLSFYVPAGKNHPSALSHASLSVGICWFHAFLYFLHLYLSVYFRLMYHLTLQMTILAIVPGKSKMCRQNFFCGLCKLWRSEN